ncbi:lactadherin-like [Styela clava]
MKSLVIFMICIALATCDVSDSDDKCMNWAIRKIVGPEKVEAVSDVGNANSTEDIPVSNSDGSGGRPGKRGAQGPPGPPGPAGPQGVCDCIPQEVTDLQKENEVLKDQISRIRRTSPETYCLLGLKIGDIPDSAITVSSHPATLRYSRLDTPSEAWHPSGNNPGHDWIMVDLGELRFVTGVVTQGRPTYDHWTTSFKVEYSDNGKKFTDVKKTDLSELVFTGNTDRNTKVVNRFPEPVTTRYIRIYPVTYSGYTMIRFDIIDC